MYIGYDNNNKIVIALKDSPEGAPFTYNVARWEYDSENEYILVGEEYVTVKDSKEIYKQKDKENIAMLHVTRLDFINMLEDIGISWNRIKGLMESYPEVEKQLMLCSNVYRGNPLIDQMAQLIDVNITSDILDELFITKCNYKRLYQE